VLTIKRKNHRKRALVAIGCTAALLWVPYTVFRAYQDPMLVSVVNAGAVKGETAQVQAVPESTIVYGLPMRLEIPSIQVSAQILYMGLTKAGDMEAPVHIEDAGWYKLGASPGNEGSAVIAGHVGVERPGIFSNLNKVRVGDRITVTDVKGDVAAFTVREIRTFAEGQRADEVFNSAGGSHLNLITCAGAWDQSKRRYSDRLVVFADKIE
jgi:LPXTG-site transpeptidase (sortase) family protein